MAHTNHADVPAAPPLHDDMMDSNIAMDHMSHTGSPGMDHMMMMYFHGGFNEVILFDFWRISTLGGLIGSMFGSFILGIIYEGIKFYRESWMRGSFQAVNYNQVV
jgi:copper transporter 1